MKMMYILKQKKAKHYTVRVFTSLEELCKYFKKHRQGRSNIYTMQPLEQWQGWDIKTIQKRLAMLKRYYDRGSTEKNPEDLWTRIAVTLNKCWRVYKCCPAEDATKLQVFFRLNKVKWGE